MNFESTPAGINSHKQENRPIDEEELENPDIIASTTTEEIEKAASKADQPRTEKDSSYEKSPVTLDLPKYVDLIEKLLETLYHDYPELFEGVEKEKIFDENGTVKEGVFVGSMATVNMLLEAIVDGEHEELLESDIFKELSQSGYFLRELAQQAIKRTQTFLEDPENANKKNEYPSALRELTRRVITSFSLSMEEANDIFESMKPRIKSKLDKKTGEKIWDMEEFIELYLANINQMILLEDKRPGSVARLHKEFGIRFFVRYSIDRLLDQLDSKGKRKKVRVLYSAASDHNGAFDNLEDNVNRYFDHDKTDRIIIEADSKYELIKRLIQISRTYGPVDDLFFGAHGTSESMDLGDELVLQEDIEESRGLARFKERGIFSQKIKLTLLSCNTGKKGGIGEAISKRIKSKVRGPKAVSYNVYKILGLILYDVASEKGGIVLRRAASYDGD